MLRKIDHIGIAVKDFEQSLRFYSDVLGLKLHKQEVVAEQKIEAACLTIGESEVELLRPTDQTSTVHQFIEKRGEGVHHIAFQVENLDQAVRQVKDNGYKLVDETPRLGVGGARMVFVHPKGTNGVLIELYEK